MEQQLWLLSCNTLDEVAKALQSDACASSSLSSTVQRTWTPKDGESIEADMRVVLNVPDNVLRFVSNSTEEARKKGGFDAAPLRGILKTLGAKFTAWKFPTEGTPNRKGVNEYVIVAEGVDVLSFNHSSKAPRFVRKAIPAIAISALQKDLVFLTLWQKTQALREFVSSVASGLSRNDVRPSTAIRLASGVESKESLRVDLTYQSW